MIRRRVRSGCVPAQPLGRTRTVAVAPICGVPAAYRIGSTINNTNTNITTTTTTNNNNR